MIVDEGRRRIRRTAEIERAVQSSLAVADALKAVGRLDPVHLGVLRLDVVVGSEPFADQEELQGAAWARQLTGADQPVQGAGGLGKQRRAGSTVCAGSAAGRAVRKNE